MIVVDVGCLTWEQPGPGAYDESLETLIGQFDPDVLFGFDVHPKMRDDIVKIAGTTCVLARRAAWTEKATLIMEEGNNCTHIVVDPPEGDHPEHRHAVEAFDLAAFLELLPGDIVLKLDCEGAEYPIVRHLVDRGVDQRLKLLLVEWHVGHYANGFEPGPPPVLRCPVGSWG